MTRDQEIRVVALDRARQDVPQAPPHLVLARADQYYRFLRAGTWTVREASA